MTQITSSPLRDWTGALVERLPEVVVVSTSAFVTDRHGHVLLHRRADNGYWSLPGGRVNPGESVVEACAREVLEETGLWVRVGRLIGVYSDPRQGAIAVYPGGISQQFVNLCFACDVLEGELRASPESTAIGFFPPEALPEPLLLAHRLRIADALSNATEPHIR